MNLSNGDNLNGIEFRDIQLEQGSTATEYQPYQTPQSYTVDLGTTELCKLGDYQDYIYKNGDDWYVHKEIGKVVLDGNESGWVYSNTYVSAFLPMDSMANPSSRGIGYLKSDYFTEGRSTTALSQWGDYSNGIIAIRYQSTPPALLGFKSVYTTQANWTTWLTSHNTTVYYALETPTNIQITDTTLIADLNALAGAKSYLDVTNFTVTATGTNLPALLKPEVYVNSLHSIIELLNSYK